MASDVVLPVLAADDLGLRTDVSEIDLVDTSGFQLYDAIDPLLVHAYFSGSFLEALPLPTSVPRRPRYLVFACGCTRRNCTYAFTLFWGGILLVFLFYSVCSGGSILSNP